MQNFRRLKNALIDLEQETSIFVGSNNSGKTSATYILQKFLDPNSKPFSIHDFSSDCWKQINNQALTENKTSLNFPSISLDIWFDVTSSDLHRIIDLLPNLDWKEVPVGVRIEYAPKNPELLIANYKELNSKAVEKAKANYHPWPKTLTDYLSKNLKNEYETKYYVLDWDQFDDTMNAIKGYIPLQLGNEKDRPGSKILKSLIKIDMLNAQRFLDDQGSGGRAEDLSKRMNRFYDRNLEKKEDDFDAMQALATSESELTKHLKTVFSPTLQSLNKLGYPGFSNPKLEVKATLNHESIIGQTRLHYSLGSGDEFLSLPDRYNGLGFKNLIYMVIEILDFHTRWLEEEENRAPLHLIIIEEPEAHLHAQLQQVFIKKIWDIINPSDAVENSFNSQMIVTTHSPHIIYESGFQPIRYFQRHIADSSIQTTNVLNLTTFYNKSHEYSRDFYSVI
ncbi:ATP-binding protein [Elizabethkingia ursingii]|uniref:ATP-binding protein n=1 Tax=Elizabethkingia ursingii TaxID=1756150 RepID=UPI00191BDF07|nr:ATP-binding protein [Elizabethkingia ursingii]